MSGRRAKKNRQIGQPGEVQPKRPPRRGWFGRGRGTATMVQAPPEYRGTTNQVCGLWPFAVGAGTPMIGVPLGRHINTGATLCCDPVSWYKDANLILNPSLFVLGKPSLGKTGLVQRMVVGLAARGTLPLVLGDTRPDYANLIRRLGGQVIELGRKKGALNVLDPGEAPEAAARLRAAGYPEAAEEVIQDALGVRLNMIESLITIRRGTPPTEREGTILSRALELLDANFEGVPLLGDLLALVREAPEPLREAALDRGDMDRYKRITEDLEASLVGFMPGGAFGDVFARHTTAPMSRDRAVCFDVSSIPHTDQKLRAAALLASWSAGFLTVDIAQILADAPQRLEPRRHYFIVLDELHQALKAGPGLVDRVDYLTRLNRTTSVGQALITHTIKDLRSVPAQDQEKAMGFIERSGYVICGGLPRAEMPDLNNQVTLSREEQDLLIGWSTPASWNAKEGRKNPPPGRGKFLVKVGGRPGIPVDVLLTPGERGEHMSSTRWEGDEAAREELDEESAA